jgi:metal-responsive CopG/Arc/MetJ family transcriptional regulator
MKRRVRVTIQISYEDRCKLDSLVFDHKADSISKILRTALRQYFERVRNKEAAEPQPGKADSATLSPAPHGCEPIHE